LTTTPPPPAAPVPSADPASAGAELLAALAPGLSPEAVRMAGGMATAFATNAAIAIVIVIAGIWISGLVAGAVRRGLTRTGRVDATLVGFFSSLVRYAILAVVGVAVLSRLGVETTSLVAVLGAASLAIGLALQGTLGHLAAGVMLIFFRPYRVGDAVDIGGKSGVVKDLTLFTTELATADNVKIIIPNGQVWGQTITNFSSHAERRVDVNVRVALEDDPVRALAAIRAVVAADGRILPAPEAPFVDVVDVTDTAFIVGVRVWVKAGDYFAVRFDLLRGVQAALRGGGFAIPYPATRAIG